MLGYLVVILLTLSACSKDQNELIVPGKTTVSELRAHLGEPSQQYTSQVRPQSKIFDYSGGCSFQVDRDTVTTIACEPQRDEVHLQYWLHRWEGKVQVRSPASGVPSYHGHSVEQIRVLDEGLAIIYDKAAQRVIRVVRHAQ
jgi:hypothetical protein